METSAVKPMTALEFSGAVDHIGSDRIYGWVKPVDADGQRAWVTITADGVTIRCAVSDYYREDLFAGGIGDGCYGFDFVFFPGELSIGCKIGVHAQHSQTGERTLLFEKRLEGHQSMDAPKPESSIDPTPMPALINRAEGALPARNSPISRAPEGGETAHVDMFAQPIVRQASFGHPGFAEQPLAFAGDGTADDGAIVSKAPASHTGPCLHIDVTHLLTSLSNHRTVTGVERVQCGYITNILINRLFAGIVRFCLQAEGKPDYVNVPVADIRRLMHEIISPHDAEFAQWRAYILHLMETGSKSAATFAAGDILLVMGATWIFPEYHVAIATAKRQHAIRYYQIFYDLVPGVLPEHCDAGQVMAFNRAIAGTLRYADHIFSISEHSAKDLRKLGERCGIAVPPVSVIPMGGTIGYNETAVERNAMLSEASDPGQDAVFNANRLHEYVLCVGTIESRKNHTYLFQVWKMLAEMLGAATPKLVLVGRLGWHIEALQRALKMTNGLNGTIIHLAQVSDRELRELYRRSLFTVFPSIYEGWGLPVGESLYYGKVPVTSGVSGMPEAGGDWAIYIDPFNAEDGLRKVSELVTDRGKLRRLENKIRKRYKPVTWSEAARGFLQQIRDLAAIPATANSAAGTDSAPLLDFGVVYALADIVRRRESQRIEDAVLDQMKVLTAKEVVAVGDWHELERWGCWSRDASARIAFRMSAMPSSKAICYLAVKLPSWYPESDCNVLVNGKSTGRFVLPDCDRTRHLRIPIDVACLPNGKVDIELEIDRIIPNPDSTADKTRPLGIGLKSIFLCLQDDVETRLAYLEEHLGS